MSIYVEVPVKHNNAYAGFKLRLNIAPKDYKRALEIINPILESAGLSYKYYDLRWLLVQAGFRTAEIRKLSEDYRGENVISAAERESLINGLIKYQQRMLVLQRVHESEAGLREELLAAVDKGDLQALYDAEKLSPRLSGRGFGQEERSRKARKKMALIDELIILKTVIQDQDSKEEPQEEDSPEQHVLKDAQITIYVHFPSGAQVYSILPKDSVAKADKIRNMLDLISSNIVIPDDWSRYPSHHIRDEMVEKYGSTLAKLTIFLDLADIQPTAPPTSDVSLDTGKYVSARFDLFASSSSENYIAREDPLAGQANDLFAQSEIFLLLQEKMQRRPEFFNEVHQYYLTRKSEGQYTSFLGSLFRPFGTFKKGEKLEAASCLMQILMGMRKYDDLSQKQKKALNQGRLGEIMQKVLHSSQSTPFQTPSTSQCDMRFQ